MKCEHCGKNEARFHYQYEVNGEIEEGHLCADCAAKLGVLSGLEEGHDSGTPIGAIFLLLPRLVEDFDWYDESQLTPAARRTLQVALRESEPVWETESLLDERTSRKLRRERERNVLNIQLSEAVETEDYERAARLRDELKRLEDERISELEGS